MKKEEKTPHSFRSLSEAARAFGLPEPQHPLICMLGAESNQVIENNFSQSHVLSFYKISYKPRLSGRVKYGQHYYDFDEGGLLFAAPGQVIGSKEEHAGVCSTYTLLIHPDFLLTYPLIKKIKQYGFFSYSANEALHLSDKEKDTIISIFKIIEEELNSRIDDFSQDVIISQIELLLNYANRFYKRQFITRKTQSNDLLQQLEEILDDYFNNEKSLNQGIPTVQYLSENLHISPSYLSDMLRSLTSQNAQQHIHNKLIEKQKKNYLPPVYQLVKLPTSWALSIPNLLVSYLKQRPVNHLWNSGNLLIEIKNEGKVDTLDFEHILLHFRHKP